MAFELSPTLAWRRPLGGVSNPEADLESARRSAEEPVEREAPFKTKAARNARVPCEDAPHARDDERRILGWTWGAEVADAEQTGDAAGGEQGWKDGDERPDPHHEKDLGEPAAP